MLPIKNTWNPSYRYLESKGITYEFNTEKLSSKQKREILKRYDRFDDNNNNRLTLKEVDQQPAFYSKDYLDLGTKAQQANLRQELRNFFEQIGVPNPDKHPKHQLAKDLLADIMENTKNMTLNKDQEECIRQSFDKLCDEKELGGKFGLDEKSWVEAVVVFNEAERVRELNNDPTMSSKLAKAYFDILDADGSGTIEKNELEKIGPLPFFCIDKDKSGTVDVKELETYIKNLWLQY